MKLWRPALVAAGLMLLCFGPALGLQLLNEGHSAQRLTPFGERVVAACSLSLPLFPAAALLWAALTRRLQARLGVVLGLLVLLGVAGAAVVLVALPPLFRGEFKASVPSRDGVQVAHVHVDGLLGCTARLYVAPRGALWGTFVEKKPLKCGTIGARWSAEGVPELVGEPPEPLNFFLGPH